ncbi:hypothetical protein [Pseudofulvimonas gallinarii]|uniref:Uncharacterized protein n=1 Tax=Pseudofulvimonas gallinarii TaxID=634155 RepID=A0A4R3L175_9GAMM|nr:hypothetical protein [Pseudofulvimonas gallinarii]TCS92062.1 hypothetical protein EDC25_1412 [Pseudofulvimonas gallinarii]THD12050.1 hypothetical protein B1808_13750 [Pseudofulvimonas gallinarii]
MTRTLKHSWLRAAFAACLALFGAKHATAGEYVPDPSRNNGLHLLENFGLGLVAENYIGRKMVRLDNGDVIVAGEVPARSGTVGTTTIGLVRYNDEGQYVAWSNPGSNGYGGGANNRYVIIPNPLTDYYVVEVRDMVVHGNQIFVLANTNSGPILNRFDAVIYVFGTDGSFSNGFIVDSAPASARTVWGSALAAYTVNPDTPSSSVELLYIGSRKPGAVEHIAFKRYSVGTTTGILHSWSENTIKPSIGACPLSIHCTASDIALGSYRVENGIPVIPEVFITGTRIDNPDVMSYVVQLNIRPGNLSVEEIGTFRVGPFNTRGRALVVDQDDLFMVAEADRACKNGVAVSRFSTFVAAPTYPTWTRHFGGSDEEAGFCNTPPFSHLQPTDIPFAVALQDGKLAVAGHGYRTQAGAESITDGFVTVLNAATGALISPATSAQRPDVPLVYYPERNSVGDRTRHTGFKDIVASGNGTFTVTGDARYPENYAAMPWLAGKRRYTTLRIMEAGPEIFANGFE